MKCFRVQDKKKGRTKDKALEGIQGKPQKAATEDTE